MRQQADHGDAGAERQRGGQQRQRHREQRAEHQEQDDPGGEEAERQTAGAALVRRLGDLALDLDLDAVAGARARGVHELLGGGRA